MASIKNAKFIRSKKDMGKICPMFLKEFKTDKKVKKATACVSAIGVYQAFINGERLGDFVLAPGWTAYKERLQFQRYDITDLIKSDNAFEISTSYGWVVKNLEYFRPAAFLPQTNRPAVIASVEIEYDDGSQEIILTDESWQVSATEILMSQIYNGEVYDARIKGERSWEPVEVYDWSRDTLIEQEGEIVRECEVLEADKIITTPKGETVIDFGQEITGYVEFTPYGEYGDIIQIDHAEMLDKDGNFYNANYRSAMAQITYICSADNKKFKTHHTFFGFRYIRLTNWHGPVNKEDFKAIAVHSDMKRTGHFECSDPMINKLYNNVIWGQLDNFLDVPTDCPQRDERLGWTGDANVFCKAAAYNFDVERFFKKWLRDLRVDQLESGAMPNVIPSVSNDTGDDGEHSSAFWGDAAVTIPWEIYLAYGDKDFLAEQFESMKKYVEFMRREGSSEYLYDRYFHFSDWLALDDVYDNPDRALANRYKRNLGTAAFANSTDILIKAGKVLGKDMTEYEKLHKGIVNAFNENYVKDGDLEFKTQTEYVLALKFNLVDDKPTYAKRLVKLIEDNGNRLTTGFVGTAYLMDALTENGCVDTAYSLLLQTQFPSWLFSVRMGATTIWEHWDSMRKDGTMWSTEMNSFNHYAYGAVAAWMYGTMGGIKYDESKPAYKNIKIKPVTDPRIGWVKVSLDTRMGTVKSEWETKDGKTVYKITIPDGAAADVTIGNETKKLGGGYYEFTK